jgi:hypothetical protein
MRGKYEIVFDFWFCVLFFTATSQRVILTLFGSGGKVTTDLGNSEFANAVALQPDGKIIAGDQRNVHPMLIPEDFLDSLQSERYLDPTLMDGIVTADLLEVLISG